MIDVHIFDLTKCAAFYVVSTPEVISDLCSFADHHYAQGDLNEEALFERILFHNAYCCILPKSLTGRLLAKTFKRVLKKRDRLIDIDFYFEAFILADPEGAASVVPFSKEDLIATAEETEWGLIFDVDRNEVVERLRRIKRN